MEKFQNALSSIAGKFAQNKFISIIMQGFMFLLPISMAGSIASLLTGITTEWWVNLLASTGMTAVLSAIYQFTVGVLALYITYGIGSAFCRVYDISDSAVTAGLVSIVCFLVVTPYTAQDIAAGISASLPFSWLGSSGMFMAIIMGFIVGGIFLFCKKKHVEIKLPDSVPPMVSQQFSALIPALLCIFIAGLINRVFAFTSFGDVQNAIYTIIAIPLQSVGANIWGQWILGTALTLFWFFGIHGGMTVYPFIQILFTPLSMENLAATQAQQPLPHIVTGTSLCIGTGSLVLILAVFIFAKSNTLRSVAKLAIVPSFFGVDEPAYFGFPMIMNPIFFFPWVLLVNTVTVFGTYGLQLAGLLPYASGASASFNAPFFIQNLVSYGWRGVLWGFVLLVIGIVIYIPFVKAYDAQLLKEEAENAKKEVA